MRDLGEWGLVVGGQKFRFKVSKVGYLDVMMRSSL